MEFLKPIEKALEPVFQKPEMPEGGKKWFLQYLPIIAIVGGVLQAVAALMLWSAWNRVDDLADIANSYAAAFGVEGVDKPTLWFWLALLTMVASAAINFLAYGPLSKKEKKGWDYLFLGSVIGVVTSVFSLLVGSNYGGGVSDFIFSLLFAAVGFWILYQIREGYLHHTKKADKKAE